MGIIILLGMLAPFLAILGFVGYYLVTRKSAPRATHEQER